MPLTQEQIDFFNENGYVSYGKFLEDGEIAHYRSEYDRMFAEANEAGTLRNLSAKKDGQASDAAPMKMLQIMNCCERNLAFRKLIYDQRILDLVQDLIGPNIMLFHDQALSKPAFTGGPVIWHQDNAYWRCRPANLVSCWMTLDDVVKENGAMQVIPGSHLKPISHEASDTVLIDSSKKIDTSKAVAVPLPAGGCMFHHCQTLHYTQENTTPNQRRAFAIHFMAPGTTSLNHAGGREPLRVDFAHPMLRASV
jgi:phytanoyl-CoA hydroxylase